MKPKQRKQRLGKQRGAAAVEFALIAAVFFSVLIGIMEMGRVLFYMNTATEATRLGARVAVVCDINDPAIKSKMQGMLSILNTTNINITYPTVACGTGTCETVKVEITGLTVNTFIPFIPFSITMPTFSTTLPIESLSSANNSLCDG